MTIGGGGNGTNEEEIKIMEVLCLSSTSQQLEVVDQDMITEQTQLEDLVVVDQEVEVDLLEQLVKEILEVATMDRIWRSRITQNGGGAGASGIEMDHLLVEVAMA